MQYYSKKFLVPHFKIFPSIVQKQYANTFNSFFKIIYSLLLYNGFIQFILFITKNKLIPKNRKS